MRAMEIDEGRWPLLIHTYDGEQTDDDVAYCLHPHVVCNDVDEAQAWLDERMVEAKLTVPAKPGATC